MEFVGVKELSQNLKKYVREKDWIIVTLHGKPKKILKDLTPEELTQLFQSQNTLSSPSSPPLKALGAYGMWNKKEQMKNGVTWVNRLRKKQEGRYSK